MIDDNILAAFFDSKGSLTKLQLLHEFIIGWRPNSKDELIRDNDYFKLKDRFGKRFTDRVEQVYLKFEKRQIK